MKKLVVAVFALCIHFSVGAQTTPLPYFTFGKGIGITAPDSTFSFNLRFRIQNRFAFKTEDTEDLAIKEVEARVRRLRLRFDGFVYTPKLTYLVQLSFSRGDMDYESLSFPNVVRDAWVQYAFTKHFSVGIGQTKLPGNRQRVNSSGDLQLPDRSLVNSVFNIDRDFGIQAFYKRPYYSLRAALTSGDGRNMNSSDNGMAYTARVEVLPFGSFINGGDYFEGDLVREKTVKVSLGLAFSHNEKATRTAGQLGSYLYANRDITTHILDALIKYKGAAFAVEHMKRIAQSPITTNTDGSQRYVYVGEGQNYQGSYLFPNNFEIVGRYTVVIPERSIQPMETVKEQYTFGINRYLKGHRVKLQTDVSLERNYLEGLTASENFSYRFQIEAGI